jgi:pimeloyl-ACP methyl ester carboxylesterase
VLAFCATWEPQRNDPLAIAAVLRDHRTRLLRKTGSVASARPVLIVNGDADPLRARRSARIDPPNVTCVTLPGVDHLGLPAQPAFSLKAVESWARSS